MKRILLDTHILVWAASDNARLPGGVRAALLNAENEPLFSVASIWEVAIKSSLPRHDFHVDAELLRAGLLAAGYAELPVLGAHAVAVASLPPIHKDPFDRLLLAQAVTEGVELLTVDAQLARYGAPVRAF